MTVAVAVAMTVAVAVAVAVTLVVVVFLKINPLVIFAVIVNYSNIFFEITDVVDLRHYLHSYLTVVTNKLWLECIIKLLANFAIAVNYTSISFQIDTYG